MFYRWHVKCIFFPSNSHLSAIPVALYLFECLLTFSQEVEVIWRRQWSAMTWIYAFTRYGQVSLVLFDVIPVWGFVVRHS